MMKALITGAAGFTGRYLSEALANAGYEVYGLMNAPANIAGVHHQLIGDLNNLAWLNTVVGEVQPNIVAHLAAISFVAHDDINAIYQTNLLGSRNLLEALKNNTQGQYQSILLASSANIYGNQEGVLTEETLPLPTNDYAVSKLAMEYLAKLYKTTLPITIARPFNYTGKGQADNFLLPKIVKHVQQKKPYIELGNLNVARDFSDVRTVVQIYKQLLEMPDAIGEIFNVCSGYSHTLNEVLTMAQEVSGHTFEVRINPAFIRANEVKVLQGNRNKLEKCIGLISNIPLEETLHWMMESQ